MKKLKLSVMAIVLTIVSIFSITLEKQYSVEAVEPETSIVYTLEDVRNLQDFLLSRETPDLNDKNYDLNGDNRWTYLICAL